MDRDLETEVSFGTSKGTTSRVYSLGFVNGLF